MAVTGQLLLQRAAEAAERDSSALTALDGRSLKYFLDFALAQCWQFAPWPGVAVMLEVPHAAGAIAAAVSDVYEVGTLWAVWDRDWRQDARAQRLPAVECGETVQLLPEAVPDEVTTASGAIEEGETYRVDDDGVIYNGHTYATDETFVGVADVTTFTGATSVYLLPKVWLEFSPPPPDLLSLPDVAAEEGDPTFPAYELINQLGRALPLLAASALLGLEGKAALSAMNAKLAQAELDREAKPIWRQRARFDTTQMLVS